MYITELWIWPGEKGHGTLFFSGLSVIDSPLLSDQSCRHRSMHHKFVEAPLLHPPPFRWKSTPQSCHTYIYMLRDTLTRHACRRTCAHTNTTHIQTSFPLWWQILPELASICDSWHGVLYESNSSRHLPFTDGSAGCPKPLSGGDDWRTVLFSNLPWSGWRRDT